MRKYDILPIGVIARFNEDPFVVFQRIRKAGFSFCQLAAPPDSFLYGLEGRRNTRNMMTALEENGITVTSVFMSFPNQDWSMEKIHNTLGLVPEEFRALRMTRACRIGTWAKEIGVDEVAAHVGFIPEDYECDLYKRFVEAMRGLALFLECNEQYFTFETGQETVKTLGRTIRDIGTRNLGINFDPANLLLYDMDEPASLVENLGSLVRHVHCKDGIRPIKKGILGSEKRLGDGDVGFEKLLRNLYAIGFRGPLTIEREVGSAPEQNADILYAKELIERIKIDLLK